MPRIRIEFIKGDQVRFLSHLDLVKAFERAIRRAAIPIAFSEGFNPHPKMSFGSALAVGVTSDSEFLDIDLREETDVNDLVARLARALPPGLQIKEGLLVPERTPSLMAEINRARYQVTARAGEPITQDRLVAEIMALLGSPEITITKRTKKGPREKNIRPGILELSGTVRGDELVFELLTTTGGDGNVRPEEAIIALTKQTGLPADTESMYIRRTELFIEKDGRLTSPMEISGQLPTAVGSA